MKSIFQFVTLLCICYGVMPAATAADGVPAHRKDSVVAKSTSTLPVIGIGYGAMTFIGDVGNSYLNEPFLYRGGFQFDVQLHSKSNVEFFFHILAGKVYGEEKSLNRNVNFMTNILMEGANVRYSFNSKTNKQQVLIPFVSVGIENISFNPYTDLKDANENTYYYWNDGTIRDLAETASDASQAKVIRRDYNYETNVRDANLDSLGKFKEYAFAFPLSIGVKFKISGRLALYFTETYHLTTTDYIDGITDKSLGSRAGKAGNDKLLYSSVSVHYDFAAPREPKKSVHKHVDQSLYNNINYTALENADADGDGVPDFMDDDNSTPKGAKVDAHGRAIDSDGDGVPDYRDKEPNSPAGAVADEYGVTITDSTQEAKFVKDSLDLEMMRIAERIKTKNEPAEGTVVGKSSLPDEFKIVDTDKDGVISADEIAKAIELYTAGKSPFQKAQFYRLIDYFFAQ